MRKISFLIEETVPSAIGDDERSRLLARLNKALKYEQERIEELGGRLELSMCEEELH